MNEKTFSFPCGCSFGVLAPAPHEGELPLLDITDRNIPESCPAVWELLASGKTRGIFQLESPLGRKWSKRLRPESLDHIAALTAVLRPGALNATDEHGVSTTEHYCLRKNGEEEPTGYHPVVDSILADSYNLIIYQEQFMRIARELCGFDLKEVDRLRKAAGKKLASEMAEVGKLFRDKGKLINLAVEEVLNKIWDIIEKSSRYSFNRAHAVSYGLRSYKTAYIKTHLPMAFYTSWLANAHALADAQQEMAVLIEDARQYAGITTLPPDLSLLKDHFHAAAGQKTLRFGLVDIKGVGRKAFEELVSFRDCGRPLAGWTWPELLAFLLPEVNKQAASAIIRAGAIPWVKIGRLRMLAEYEAFLTLTELEQDWMRGKLQDGVFTNAPFVDILRAVAVPRKEGGGAATSARGLRILEQVRLLENPTSSLEDSARYIADCEEELLKVPLTCARADSCDRSEASHDLAELSGMAAGQTAVVCVEVTEARATTTKQGKDMLRPVTAKDGTGAAELVCFPDAFAAHGHLIKKGALLVIKVEKTRPRNGYDSSYSIVKAWRATEAV